MATAYVTHAACLHHEMGEGHPERPARLRAVQDGLRAAGLFERLDRHDAPLVTREALERVHDPDYLDSLEARAPRTGMVVLDPDTAMNPFSLEAARRAAGAAVLGVDLVLTGKAGAAFCAVRPPGHHAERARAMGFCLYNNVAVAAAHALASGLARVAIVDFDVHHGNGTEDIFAGDPRVLLASTFQHPLYPFSGLRPRGANIISVPLEPGSGTARLRPAYEREIFPALQSFGPDMVFFSAGFDAHRNDPLAALSFVEEDYGWVTAGVLRVTEATAARRAVSTLEGGYDLEALGRCAAAHVGALI